MARLDPLARMFEDDTTTDPADAPQGSAATTDPSGDDAVYAFEGYAIEFNDKVALLPLQPLPTPVAGARAGSASASRRAPG